VWWLQPARGPFEPGTPPPLLLTSLVQELDAELRTRCGLGPSFLCYAADPALVLQR
jgi:hypothetical protein